MKKFRLRFSSLRFVFIFCTENRKISAKNQKRSQNMHLYAKYANLCKFMQKKTLIFQYSRHRKTNVYLKIYEIEQPKINMDNHGCLNPIDYNTFFPGMRL